MGENHVDEPVPYAGAENGAMTLTRPPHTTQEPLHAHDSPH